MSYVARALSLTILASLLAACAANQPGETTREERPKWENAIPMREATPSAVRPTNSPGRRPEPTATLVASRAKQPVRIDGKLDDPVWQNAKVYSLELPTKRVAAGRGYDQVLPSTAQIAWDDSYLYVGASFRDRDLVAMGNGDQQHNYRLGDTFEVFLSPTRATGYWELHTTPKQNRTAWFYPGGGHFSLPHLFEVPLVVDFPTASVISGTLNQSDDLDQSWTVEIAIPVAELAEREQVQWPANDWLLLLARINFSRYVRDHGPQYATAPQIATPDFHRQYQYAKLQLAE